MQIVESQGVAAANFAMESVLRVRTIVYRKEGTETEFVNIYGAQESIPMQPVVPARQVGNRFLGSLKGLQIRALTNFYGTLQIRKSHL